MSLASAPGDGSASKGGLGRSKSKDLQGSLDGLSLHPDHLDDDTSASLAERLRTSTDLSAKVSGPSSPPSSQSNTSPWSSQSDWIRHESFVHSLDQLDDGEEDEDGEGVGDDSGVIDDDLIDDEADVHHLEEDEQEQTQGEAGTRDSERRLTAHDSAHPLAQKEEKAAAPYSPSEYVTTQDTELRFGSLRSGGPLSPNTAATHSTSSYEDYQDNFFDAMSASPDLGRESAAQKKQVHEALASDKMAPSSFHTTDPTQVQNSRRDLHHQDSAATLLGASGSRQGSLSSLSKSKLPPPRPTPTLPLPLLPTGVGEVVDPSASGSSSGSSLYSRIPSDSSASSSGQNSSANKVLQAQSTLLLGPSGTIRGRPRGATIGAMPGKRAAVRTQTRPRSLLSHELMPDELAAAASSFRAHREERAQADDDSSLVSTQSSAAETSRSAAMTMLSSNDDVEGSHNQATKMEVSRNAADTSPGTNAGGASGAVGAASSSKASGSGTRSRSGSNTSLLQQVQLRTRPRASFVIAVVGHSGAGKSTVIRKGLRQFGLSKPQAVSDKITSHSTVCIVDHEQRTIEVLEVDASALFLTSDKRFAWPKFLPHVDAAILCYDASNSDSFRGMPELLENFSLNGISTVMLACKSERSPKVVDPFDVSDMASVYNVGLAECSVQSEEGKKRMRDCFSYLVKEVAKARAQVRGGTEDTQDGDLSTPAEVGRQAKKRHEINEINAAALRRRAQTTSAIDKAAQKGQGEAASTRLAGKASSETASDDDDALQQSISRAEYGLQSAKSAGGYVSIEELYDKLFFAAVSGNDERFLLMFMTFYRGFAQPLELLRQIVSRFDALARGEHADGIMIRYSLMKLTTMLGDWMHEYPGDLSSPHTYALLREFFDRVMHHPSTKHIAAPMLPLLETVKHAPDLDAAWSKNEDSDKPTSIAAEIDPVSRQGVNDHTSLTDSAPSADALTPAAQSKVAPEPREEIATGAPEAPQLGGLVQGRHRSTSDATLSSDGQGSHGSASASGSSNLDGVIPPPDSRPGSVSLASLVAGAPQNDHERKNVMRSVSNALLEIKEEAVANELTRIEWELFSKIGPRDLLRHILVPREIRSQESPIARNIAHFNYISGWVGSMILVQSKTKQRARMMEKFIVIASILRRINNYNTLHAILAGLGNSSIHRLKHTNEHLNGKHIYKTYQSLTRLMGSERSFAAYRLALENSEGRTIPYLGVHLQDILSTSDGNPSKRKSDGMIHWRKFSLMHDAVMAIVHCQEYQIGLQPNASISKLIVNLPTLDEDALYQRSLQVEPRQLTAGHSAPGSRIIRTLFHPET